MSANFQQPALIALTEWRVRLTHYTEVFPELNQTEKINETLVRTRTFCLTGRSTGIVVEDAVNRSIYRD